MTQEDKYMKLARESGELIKAYWWRGFWWGMVWGGLISYLIWGGG